MLEAAELMRVSPETILMAIPDRELKTNRIGRG
jgi:excisionase family DNA binding protein